MPTVNIPEVGRVRFPDDMAEADIAREANGLYLRRQQDLTREQGEAPASNKLLDALVRVPAGVQSGTGRTLAGAVRGADIAATPTFIPFMGGFGPGAETINRLNQQMPAVREKYTRGRPQRLAQSTAYQLGREIEHAAPETFGVDPARDSEFLAQLATAAGELVPTMSAGTVAGPAGVLAQYGTSAGESQAQEAIAAGREDVADIAYLTAAGWGGLTEAAIGVPGRVLQIANRARKAGVNPGKFGQWANRNPMASGIAKAGAEGAIREGAQEGLEQVGGNFIASDLAGYDPKRRLGEGVGRAVALGAILGGGVAGGAAGVNQAQRNALAADLRAKRAQRWVGVTQDGQPIPAADSIPDPLADLRAMAKPAERPSGPNPPDAARTDAPATATLPDGRVVVVNQETGSTDFPQAMPEVPGVPEPLEGQPYDLTDAPKVESPRPKVETDPARRQEIANSIEEGRLILRTGSFNGRKLSVQELLMVRRSVENALAKLGQSRLAGKSVGFEIKDVTPPGYDPEVEAEAAPTPNSQLPTPRPAPEAPKVIPYGKEAIQSAFNLTPEQAEATDAIVKAMGLDESRIQVAKGGEPSAGALRQFAGERGAAGHRDLEKQRMLQDALQAAKAMAAAGKTPEQIRAVTGWFPGKYDGKMRWEVPDEGAVVKGTDEAKELIFRIWANVTRPRNRAAATAELQDVIRHPGLFAAYPDAASIPVLTGNGFGARGSLVRNLRGFEGPVIQVRPDLKGKELLATLLHEIQHWIQDKEGFARGASPHEFTGEEVPKMAEKINAEHRAAEDAIVNSPEFKARVEELTRTRPQVRLARSGRMMPDVNGAQWQAREEFGLEVMEEARRRRVTELLKSPTGDTMGSQAVNAYRRTAGEIEARDVQARQEYTPEQRKAIAPYSSENIAPEDAIVLKQGRKGAAEFAADGKAIIRGLQSADVSTGVHEVAHVARRQLFDRGLKPEERAGITDADIASAEEWAGAKDGVWDRPAEEKFARGFERYLRDGHAPTEQLRSVFTKFKEWLTDIYRRLVGSEINVRISAEMRGVFDRLVARAERLEAPAPGNGESKVEVPDSVREGERIGVVYAKRSDGSYKPKSEYTSDEWKAYTDSVIDAKLAAIQGEAAAPKPAEVRPAEPGEQAAPPAQAAPAMQEGMDNLRFTSEPVKTSQGFADAKDAKAKLIAELEKAVEQAKPITPEQTRALDKGPYVPSSTQAMYYGEEGKKAWAEDVRRNRSEWEQRVKDSGLRKVTIEIPGDGTFTVWNTKENLTELLKRAKRLETSTKPPKGYTESGASKEDREWVEQMQQAQGKPMKLWEVRYRDWNNNNLETTVEARTEFEAEDKVGNEVKGAAKILPGTRYVGEAPAKPTEGARYTKAAAYPGGDLGTSPAPQPPPPAGPVPPAQDREFSVFPFALPELVKLARLLGQGHFPKLKERINGGRALGVFRYLEGDPRSGRIELTRGLWKLVLDEEKADLERKAQAYAEASAQNPDDPAEVARLAREKFAADLEALMTERLKQEPILAVKVLAHEIGHWIDFLPQAMISGRGNLFGHVASLKRWLKHTISWDPKFAELNGTGELTSADRAKLRRAAERELEQELGPIREIIEKVLIEEPVFATTGVTPEDVKRLFGMDAREAMPELYLWFAQLDAATKKEVVRAAMKGMVDARVPASRIQTGTRTVEREVRKVSGRMPTPEEITARFREKLHAAMEARRNMDLKEVKQQLREAITWWRGAKEFEEYFATPEEMYAEAFSIFLANPAALAQRAPKYFNALLNYMDRKPEAAKAYADLQLAIRQGAVHQQREKDLLAGFARDEERFKARAKDRKPPMDRMDNLIYHMDRRLGPIYRRARGSQLEGTIRGVLGDFNYRGAEHERFLSTLNREVSQPLVEANLEWSDLGLFMFHKRVVEHYDEKSTPIGFSPKSSREALEEMRARFSPAQWATLEEAQRRFMAQYQAQVVPLLKTSGLTTPELQQLIEDRLYYATFQAVKDDPQDAIESLLAQRFGAGVTSHIYRRVGNLGEVANPATATLLKALSLMSAAYRNNAKRHLPAMLEEMGLPVREVEKTWDKNLNALTYDLSPLSAASPVQKLVFLENGKPKAYYVETSIAEAFNSGDPIENNLLLGVLAASRGMKRLFTELNYGFWPFAAARDVVGFGLQMPGLLAPLRYFKYLPQSFAASRASLKGTPNPLADQALARKVWISQADPYGVRDAAENEAELQIAAHGLTPARWAKTDWRHKLAAAFEWYKQWGKVLERTHKTAGMLYLDEHYPDLPEWQKREMVREWAGSPDFLQQPGDRRWINALALFYNPWKESLRSVAKAAKHDPKSFAAKATLLIAMPTVLQSLAVMGLLGDDLEEMYNSIGDYDLTNYLVFPLGWEDRAQGKVRYLRFPLFEPARMAHGFLFGQITGHGEKPLSHAGGQVPGLNPLLTATAAWLDYTINGRNPYDSHYGREILDPKVFKAGGSEAHKAMLKWTWNQLGGSLLFRFDTRPEHTVNDTSLEAALKKPGVSNLVGRWLRVSNRGVLDTDKKLIEPGERNRAVTQLAVDAMKATLLRGGEITEAERTLLSVDPYAREYLLRTIGEDLLKRESFLYKRLERAPNTEAKIKILTEGRAPAPARAPNP